MVGDTGLEPVLPQEHATATEGTQRGQNSAFIGDSSSPQPQSGNTAGQLGDTPADNICSGYVPGTDPDPVAALARAISELDPEARQRLKDLLAGDPAKETTV